METDLHHQFLTEIAPRLRIAVRRYVRPVAPEDHQELTQEALAIAWRSSLALLRRGRPILPAPIVFYTIRRLRSGRRFLSSGRTDVLSPGCRLDGHSRTVPIASGAYTATGPDAALTPTNCLVDPAPDPAAVVTTRLDVQAFLSRLSGVQRLVLEQSAAGRGPTTIAAQLGVSPPRISQIRRLIADKAHRFWQDCAPVIPRGPP